jgi:hypothetical protein
MTVSITHSWAIGAAVCSARRLQAFTTTEWDTARAEREAQSLVGLNAISPGLPRHYRTMRIGGRKIGDGTRKVATMAAAELIAESADSVL